MKTIFLDEQCNQRAQSLSDCRGEACLAPMRVDARASHLQRGDVDPAPLLPAPYPRLRKLHAVGALEQRPFERSVLKEMAEENLPLRLEAVVVGGHVGHL